MELRDAYPKFQAAGVKLYAISYDDQEALAAFAGDQNIPFPLLSDVESQVIRRYGVLNTEVTPHDEFLYGIPFPGTFVTDENGVVITKFFYDSYKKRDSAENLLDAALGRIDLTEDTPRATGGDRHVNITVAVHGGRGTIRQGLMRKLVVRFELGDGLHIYGPPVPDGLVATQVTVKGPPGLVILDPVLPPAEPFRLTNPDVELQVWTGTVDIVIPFYGVGELVSEVRPLDDDSVTVEVAVRYQACDDDTCLLPRSETFKLEVPLEVVDVPAMPIHMGHGQREGGYDTGPHMKRLFMRKAKKKPLALPRFLWKSIKLEWAAKRRAATQTTQGKSE